MKCYQETYEKNRTILNDYPWWRYKELPLFEELEAKAIQVGENLYCCHGLEQREAIAIKPTKINTKPFFRDLSKPLFVENEFNSYHFAYLTDNVRASEDYGKDNHIYMYYESWSKFYLLLQLVDITPYLTGKKIVFLVEKKEYPLDFKKEYGVDYEAMGSKPLGLDEINRFVFDWYNGTRTGNVFFSGVLDSHPDLLTMGELSMGGFKFFYEELLACFKNVKISFKTSLKKIC